VHSWKSAISLSQDGLCLPTQARLVIVSGQELSPTHASLRSATAIMITSSDSLVEGSRTPNQLLDVRPNTMAISGLSCVSVRAYRPAKFHENNLESKAEWERLRSGEIDFAVEKWRLSACLIRSVRG